MQSVLGALLTAGYATAFAKSIAASSQASSVSTQVQNQLEKSFSSAAATAQQYPKYANQIIAAAKSSFLDGADWAYLAGILAVLLGGLIVFFLFPHREEEQELLASYRAEDEADAAA